MRASISVFLAGLVLAGCTSVTGPGFTIPPGFTLPPLPSLPPLDLPSIDITLPTLAPGGNTTGACALVSEAEMSTIVGQTMTVRSSTGNECTYTSPSFTPSAIIRFDSGESIAAGKIITSNGRDLTIGGFPAFYGEFAGSLLYIEKGGRVLVIQTIWSLSGDEAVQKVSQMGELAVPRFN
jgi:hypothetical protein